MERVLHFLWIAGYLVGTATHVFDLVVGGREAYAGFPDPVRLFWVSLVVVDPLVAALLILRLLVAIVLGVSVIVIDVAVNYSVVLVLGGLSLFGLVCQGGFAVAVLASANRLWKLFGRTRMDRAAASASTSSR